MTLNSGMLAPDFTAETPFHGTLRFDDLQGCPLPRRNDVRQAAYLKAAGRQIAAVFYSSVVARCAHLLLLDQNKHLLAFKRPFTLYALGHSGPKASRRGVQTLTSLELRPLLDFHCRRIVGEI